MKLTLLPLSLLLIPAAVATAQAPQVTALWPPGGPVGTSVASQVEGTNLAGVASIIVSGRGVKTEMGKPEAGRVPVTLTIASDAEPGAHEVRVISPKGISNPAYLWVDAVPQIAEVEPNNQMDQAMKLPSLPICVYGRSDAAEDVDWYSFEAGAGDTFVFDVCANRIYSPIDPFLELRDEKGHLLGTATEGYDRDPRLIYTFKSAGSYRIQMRDTPYRGGPAFVYRLTIGKLPVINALYPPGGRKGEKLVATPTGANLGSTQTITLDLPSDLPESHRRYVMPITSNGPALPYLLVADGNPQVSRDLLAPEGNAMGLPAAPVTVNARLDRRKQVDAYLFSATAGKPLTLTIHSRSAGSRLDAYMRILDQSGKELMNSDDQIGRDPRLVFTPPANGAYRVEVNGLDGTGGPEYFYRLSITAAGAPDFRLSAAPDLIALGHGQTATITVTADRRAGYNEDIVLRAEGLPAGVSASPLTLGPGQTTGTVTLTAAPDAALAGAPIRLVGEGLVNTKLKLSHVAVPIASLPRPGEGQVVPRAVEIQLAAVTDAVPLYTLTPESTAVTLAPGQTVMLKIRAVRQPGNNAANPAIALTLANLPPGVTAQTPAIAEKQNEVTINLVAAKDAKAVTGYALLTGKLGENVQPAPGLVITVKP